LVASTNNEHVVLVHYYCAMGLSTERFVISSKFYMVEFVSCSIKFIKSREDVVLLIYPSIEIYFVLEMSY
jgi:hypothetical protein